MTDTNKSSLHMLPADPTNWGEMQGKAVQFNTGEGALYVKFTALTPGTLKGNPDLATHVDRQPGFIYVGSMAEMRQALLEGFDEMAATYQKAVDEFNAEENKNGK